MNLLITERRDHKSQPASLAVDLIKAVACLGAVALLGANTLAQGTTTIFAAGTVNGTTTNRAEWDAGQRGPGGTRLLPNKPFVSGTPGQNGIRVPAREPDEIGPYHRSWRVDDAGKATSRPGHLVSLASGMNYWTGTNWSRSEPAFEVSPEGDAFVATKVMHRVRLAGDIASRGAVTLVTPDGITLRSTPVATPI